MRATAVIGANFGDEGKGLMTDYFSAKEKDTLVVRYNGGSQAGHTVVTPDGQRHVFGHFGSGSFNGSATFLSSYFIINPFIWEKELRQLNNKGIRPKLFFSDLAIMTLPWDMIINQEVERKRNKGKHGSCGLGINETVTRCYGVKLGDNREKFITTTCSYLSRKERKDYYIKIRDGYCTNRLKELDLQLSPELLEIFYSDNLLENFINLVEDFNRVNKEVREEDILDISKANHVVFEGAQGLLLDEDHEYFPYVTRSKTGLANICSLCKLWGIEDLDVCYATRAYMTRHGAGPFKSENKTISYEDKTNVHNEFQGTLRFGLLDMDLLLKSISNDLLTGNFIHKKININTMIAITCMDQVPEEFNVIFEDKEIKINKTSFLDLITNHFGIKDYLVSNGPTRNDISSPVVKA